MDPVIVTVDGPAGAGKSTVARRVAQALGIRFLDTGAMYRAAAWKARREGIAPSSGPLLADMIRRMKLEMAQDRVWVDGVEVTQEIRSDAVGEAASVISTHAEVRAEMVRRQREEGKRAALVTEGRDQGSVVFPDARHKFFLTASVQERARRRHRELESRGIRGAAEEVLSDLKRRDERDASRAVAPLRVPNGAIQIDTTDLPVERVVETILGYIQSHEPSAVREADAPPGA